MAEMSADASGDVEPTIDLSHAATSDESSNRARAIFLGVALVVIIGGVAFARLVSSFGAPDASTRAMPADTQFFLNIDLKVFLDSDIGRFADTFPDLFDDPANAEQELVDELSGPISDETSLDFETDISPWLARSVGFGIWDLDETLQALSDPFSAADDPELPVMLIAVANRDPEAAQAAIAKLADHEGATTVGDIGGSAVYEFTADSGSDDLFPSLFVIVSDRLVLASNKMEGLNTAVAVQAGEAPSLRDDDEYQSTLGLLPRGPGTIYAYGSSSLTGAYQDFVGEVTGDLGLAAPTTPVGGSFAASFAVTDEGLRFDVAQRLPEPGQGPLDFAALRAADELTPHIPATALGYGAAILDTDQNLYDLIEETYDSIWADQFDGRTLAETIDELESDADLAPGAIRSTLAAIDPGAAFYFGSESGYSYLLPYEFALLLPLNDPVAARSGLEALIEPALGSGVAPTELGWAIEDTGYVGVLDSILYFTTGDVPEAGDSIIDTQAHADVARALGTTHVWGFVNLTATYDFVVEAETDVTADDLAPWRPITAAGAGGEVTEDSVSYSVVILIDWESPG